MALQAHRMENQLHWYLLKKEMNVIDLIDKQMSIYADNRQSQHATCAINPARLFPITQG